MALVRWDPFRELERWDPFKEMGRLQEKMSRLFEEGGFPFRGTAERAARAWAPPVDIYETDKEVILKAELPGIDPQDFSVEVRDNTLILKGERKLEREVKEENYHQVERYYGTFHRSFMLPSSIQQDQVKARYRDGVLEITLPKVEVVQPKQIAVEVEQQA